ncbi:hypothetical protein V1519DRAFT_445726 [Lipomyces tetrasporus]
MMVRMERSQYRQSHLFMAHNQRIESSLELGPEDSISQIASWLLSRFLIEEAQELDLLSPILTDHCPASQRPGDSSNHWPWEHLEVTILDQQ